MNGAQGFPQESLISVAIFYYYGSAEGHEYPVLYKQSDNYYQ